MKMKNMMKMKMQCEGYVVCMHGKLEMTRGARSVGTHVHIAIIKYSFRYKLGL